MNEPIFSMLTGKGPLPGGGQTLNYFTLSGVPVEWGLYPMYSNGQNNFPSRNMNFVYVDENTYYGGNGPQPGASWVSAGDGGWKIYYSSNLGSCTCYDESNQVLGTRQLGAGWGLAITYPFTIRAYAPGSIASIPPTTNWYHLFRDNEYMDVSCSRDVFGEGVSRGFQDCHASILAPTSPYHPGYAASLNFTPV